MLPPEVATARTGPLATQRLSRRVWALAAGGRSAHPRSAQAAKIPARLRACRLFSAALPEAGRSADEVGSRNSGAGLFRVLPLRWTEQSGCEHMGPLRSRVWDAVTASTTRAWIEPRGASITCRQ